MSSREGLRTRATEGKRKWTRKMVGKSSELIWCDSLWKREIDNGRGNNMVKYKDVRLGWKIEYNSCSSKSFTSSREAGQKPTFKRLKKY